MSKETTEEIAELASKLMKHHDSEVRRVAASCLAQYEEDSDKD